MQSAWVQSSNIDSCSALRVFLGSLWFFTRSRKVYLVDFACYKPGPEYMCSKEHFMELSRNAGTFSDENLAFQKKILVSWELVKEHM